MMTEEYNRAEFTDLVYKPPQHDTKPQDATIGVKFSKDIYVNPEKAKQWGINETIAEWVPDGPWGPCWRVKR